MKPVHTLALAALILIAGCGQDASVATPNVAAALPLENVPTNLTLGPGQFALHHDGYSAVVGQDAGTAIEHITYDRKKFPVTTLPARFENPPYTANGWESIDGTEGFGAICLKGMIAAAILRERYDSRDEASEAIQRYTEDAGVLTKSAFSAGDYRFIFWEEPPLKNRTGNRMMILVAPAKDNKVQLTIALGAIPVLDAIGVNEKTMRADMTKLQASPLAGAASKS